MPSALVITTAGINCDRELAHAFTLAGAEPELVHLNRLIADPSLVEGYDLIGLPGGFSYGDAVAAGRIAAALIRQHLYATLVRAVERGVPVIAPCNGFQIACQVGLLPGPATGEPWPATPPRPTVSLADNESARFVDRWVRVEVPLAGRCIWTEGLDGMDAEVGLLPVAHGEGRFVPGSEQLLEQLERDERLALRYAADDNPNGSVGDIAGICDATGLVLGLMPHPERYTSFFQHPFWTRLEAGTRTGTPLGLAMFRNAVKRARQRAAV
jgi:phosphoribosylformylglycinamidine synthase